MNCVLPPAGIKTPLAVTLPAGPARTGPFGLEHMIALPAAPGSQLVTDPNSEVRNAGVQ